MVSDQKGSMSLSQDQDQIVKTLQSNPKGYFSAGNIKSVGVTSISDIIGEWGPFQNQMLIFFVLVFVIAPFQNLGITFYSESDGFWCKSRTERAVENPTSVNISHKNQCLVNNFTCTEFDHDHSFYRSTIVTEFNLVCDKSWYISSSKSVFQLGYLVSSIFFGLISDKYGRTWAYRSATILELVASLCQALAVNIEMFMVSRFFLGFGGYGRYLSGMLILMEWAGPKARAQVKMFLEFGWVGGSALVPIAFYLVRHFRWIQLIVFFYELAFIYWIWKTPESPTWLLLNGKYNEATESLTKAGVRNERGSSHEIKMKIMLLHQSFIMAENERMAESKKSLIDLWKSRIMLKYCLSQYFIWFSVSFVAYGFAYNATDIGQSVYITFFCFSVFDIINTVIIYYIVNRFDRKTLAMFFMFCGATALFIMIPFSFVGWGTIPRTVFAVIGKFMINGTFHMIYLQSAEIFPTGLRQIGVGSCSVAARIGSILAPFVRELNRSTHLSVSIAIFAVLGTTSGFLFLLLPETRNQPIPNSIQEAERRQDEHVNMDTKC